MGVDGHLLGRSMTGTVGARALGSRAQSPTQLRLQLLAQRALARFERGSVYLLLFAISGAVIPLVLKGGTDDLLPGVEQAPGLLERALYWVSYGLIALGLAARPRGVLQAVRVNPWPVLFVVLLMGSMAWSSAPGVTLHHVIPVLAATGMGLSVAAQRDARAYIRIVLVCTTAAVIMSWAMCVLAPNIGVTQHVNIGAWRGVFRHKNQLGEIAMLAALTTVVAAKLRWWSVPRAVVGVVLAVGLVVLSHSATSLVLLLLTTASIPVLQTARRGGAPAAGALVVLVVAAAAACLVLDERETVFAMLGRDVTLTGRTGLWAEVLRYIRMRPILGYGMGVFWDTNAGFGATIRGVIGWSAPHAHNGFLDVLLDSGVVGLALFVTGYVVGLRRWWREYRRTGDGVALWAVLLFALLVLTNLTETTITEQQLEWWATFVVLACMRPAAGADDASAGARSAA